jgi:hypothetical protein
MIDSGNTDRCGEKFMTGADGSLLNAEKGWYAGATVEVGVGCSLAGKDRRNEPWSA